MATAYLNCRIKDSDDTAFLVEDHLITGTGSDEEIRALLREGDETVELNGMYAVPGFCDTHMHLLGLGEYLSTLMLNHCTGSEEVLELTRRALPSVREGQWLRGRGYHDNLQIDKKSLDAISTDVPIVLIRACGHVACANSKALELTGITEETEAAEGDIDYANGIIKENALRLLKKAWKEPDEETLKEYIRKGAEYCNANGITAVGSDDFVSFTSSYKPALKAFEHLAMENGMNLRVSEQCEFHDPEEFSKFLDEGYTTGVGNDAFIIGPLKLILDGSLGARTAALTEPYSDDPDSCGILIYDDGEVETFFRLAQSYNMPVISHAIGDAALDQILDVYEENMYEGNPLHNGLVHCQIMRKDQLERILKLNLSCYIQTLFIDYDAGILEERVGERAKYSYPFATLYRNVPTANGSDAPVELPDPLKGIELAVTRKSLTSGRTMNANESLTAEEALDSYTDKAYEQLGMENCGKIREGYFADFAVLSADPAETAPEKIHEITVMMTVMDGRTVYER